MFPKIVGFPPKSSILIGFSIIFTIHFGGPPIFGNTHFEPLRGTLQITRCRESASNPGDFLLGLMVFQDGEPLAFIQILVEFQYSPGPYLLLEFLIPSILYFTYIYLISTGHFCKYTSFGLTFCLGKRTSILLNPSFILRSCPRQRSGPHRLVADELRCKFGPQNGIP